MKRLIFALILLIGSVSTVNAQYNTEFGLTKSIGIDIGYSMLHTGTFGKQIKEGNQGIVTVDANIYGLYFGFGYGQETIYQHSFYYGDVSENFNTYVFRIGPSFSIGNYNIGINIIPYVGIIRDTYSQLYDDYYYHYTETLYEKPLKSSFLYGGKLELYIQMVEIGTHISNKEFGITIGLRI